MLEELELANSLYNASLGLDDPTKDGIYGGDIAKWQKFTNTLRLRLLMRVSGRNNAFTPTVGEQINQIISNPGKYPVFESNDDNATVKFSGSAEYYKTYFNSSSFPTTRACRATTTSPHSCSTCSTTLRTASSTRACASGSSPVTSSIPVRPSPM